jgi:hypothetical protein
VDEHIDVAAAAVQEPVGQVVLIDQAGQLEDQVVSDRDPGQEHGPSVYLLGVA